MFPHREDSHIEQQNKWSKEIDGLGPQDTMISDSPHELINDLYNDIESSYPPTLPRFPMRAALPISRKRDRDEMIASSSDAPLFSSDDLPSSCAENYLEMRRKRQHQRSWFEEEDLSNIAKPSIATFAKHPSDESWRSPGPRCRRQFTRAFDSGVWMGSDETTGDGDFDETMDQNLKEMEEHEAADGDEPIDGLLDDDTLAQTPQNQRRIDLITKALQTTEDPGDFEGPIFPYWQIQPDDLETYHTRQRAAQERVLECVEKGKEELDLS